MVLDAETVSLFGAHARDKDGPDTVVIPAQVVVRLIAVFVYERELDGVAAAPQSPNDVPPSRIRAPRTEVSCGTGNAADVILRLRNRLDRALDRSGRERLPRRWARYVFSLPHIGDIYRRSGLPDHSNRCCTPAAAVRSHVNHSGMRRDSITKHVQRRLAIALRRWHDRVGSQTMREPCCCEARG